MFDRESFERLNITTPMQPERPNFGNVLITGQPDTGKTYFSRLIALHTMLRGESIVICAKDDAYDKLAAYVLGTVVDFSKGIPSLDKVGLQIVRFDQQDPEVLGEVLNQSLEGTVPDLLLLDEVYRYGQSQEVDRRLAGIPTSVEDKPRLLFVTQDRQELLGREFYEGFETKIHFFDKGVCGVSKGSMHWTATTHSNRLEHEFLSDGQPFRRGMHGEIISSYAIVDSTMPNLVIVGSKK